MPKIGPFSMTTAGGFPAVIADCDPTHLDPLSGIFATRFESLNHARWDRSGRCRGFSDACNIDPEDPTFKEAVAACDEAPS